jgi:quinol monooxygenase YgiN
LQIIKQTWLNDKFNKLFMTTISTENNYLTLINVFTVDPSNQQQLVELLTLATESSVRNITGFISSSLHSSIDGTRVTMYAQWKSLEDYQKMRNNPTASPYLEQALQIATFEPGMYKVVKTFLPAV